MDIDHRKDHAEGIESHRKNISKRITEDGKVVRAGKKQKIAKKIYTQSCRVMEERAFPDWRHVLIDYRNNNEQIKSRNMTVHEAAARNRDLQGSGFAWARCGA